MAALGDADPGHIAIDLAIVDARPAVRASLAIEAREGGTVELADTLSRVPPYALIARRYRRAA